MSVQIFINGFAPKKCVVYNGDVSNTIKDLKRFLKSIYNIPTYRQNIVYNKILSDDTILKGFDNCTFNLTSPIFAGPEKIINRFFDKSLIYVYIILPKFNAKLYMLVEPYWYIGGRGGLIDRIAEFYPELDNKNLQLILDNKRLNNDSRIGDYPDIAGSYINFTNDSLKRLQNDNNTVFQDIISQIGKEQLIEICNENPFYGYYMNLKRKNTHNQNTILTLKLLNE